MTRLLDSHCHLDAYPDPRTVLAKADAADVNVVAVSETPEAYRRLRTRLGRTPGVSVALGLHPGSREAAAVGQLERFLRMLPDAPWIGEVGLDFAPGTDGGEKARQTRTFTAVLEHRLSQSKPMTVHSRGAAKETVKLLIETGQRALLHWYSGDLATAESALTAGLWFSVNPAMVRSAKGRSLISRLPLERVLCETDGPYCTVGNRPVHPADVPTVARSLAETWSCTESDAWSILSANAVAFLSDRPNPPQQQQQTINLGNPDIF